MRKPVVHSFRHVSAGATTGSQLYSALLRHSLDLGQDLVGIKDAVGVKDLLDLGHQVNYRLRLSVPAQQGAGVWPLSCMLLRLSNTMHQDDSCAVQARRMLNIAVASPNTGRTPFPLASQC
jgi:hypothetical protein